MLFKNLIYFHGFSDFYEYNWYRGVIKVKLK